MNHINLPRSDASFGRQRVELIRADVFRDNPSLRGQLLKIMEPSYEDASALLTRELEHCTHLYLCRNADMTPVCFFLVAWETIAIRNRGEPPSVYMGLSATRQDTKNSGLIRRAYWQAMVDAEDYQRQFDSEVIAWATTATPTSYFFSTAMLSDIEPKLDGTYSPDGAMSALSIRERFGYDLPAIGHPFVLRALAHNTRYSATERERIGRVTRGNGFTLFNALGIDERRGDRLLIIGRIRRRRSEREQQSVTSESEGVAGAR